MGTCCEGTWEFNFCVSVVCLNIQSVLANLHSLFSNHTQGILP